MFKLKNFDENFAAIYAYLCADGWITKLNPKKPKYRMGLKNSDFGLLKDFQCRFEKVFGLKPNFTGDFESCTIGSKSIHQFLIHNFGSFHSYE